MTLKFEKIGKYLRLSNDTNTNLDLSRVRGVSITKQLIKTKANMKDVDISDYKVVHKGQFVFNPNTARMGEKIPIAMNTGDDVLVSKIYPVFEVIDRSVLLPEYLFLWFKRPEFDRYARFHSWGSARETFNWENMCSVSLPIPSLARQEAIVNIFKALEKRKEMNQIILDMLNTFPPTIMQGVRSGLVKSVR